VAAVQDALADGTVETVVIAVKSDEARAMIRAACDAWRDDDVLILPGDAVIDVEWGHLPDEPADVVLVARPHELEVHQDGARHFTGAAWFRDGAALAAALDATSATTGDLERDVVPALKTARVVWREARLCLPLVEAGEPSPSLLLAANARLLSFGRSSAEAIERSYSEEFTVIPPVFIHEDAVVESSVIASQTSLAAGAIVRNSVLHRCLVGPGAIIENAVLDGALIGAGARVSGQLRPLLLPDGQTYAA
jgi:glucose-1-phosphate thymidylyltransferase